METITLSFLEADTTATLQIATQFYTPVVIVWMNKCFVLKQPTTTRKLPLEYDEVFSYFIPPDQSVPEGSS